MTFIFGPFRSFRCMWMLDQNHIFILRRESMWPMWQPLMLAHHACSSESLAPLVKRPDCIHQLKQCGSSGSNHSASNEIRGDFPAFQDEMKQTVTAFRWRPFWNVLWNTHNLLCLDLNPPDFQEIFIIRQPSANRAFSSEKRRRRQCLAWPLPKSLSQMGSSWGRPF